MTSQSSGDRTRHRISADLPNDPHDLQRFVDAQSPVHEQALVEIRGGLKRSHWMWYVFPQYAGLGSSPTSRKFAIGSIAEAKAYLRHDVLGPRLMECSEALLVIEGRSAHQIFGADDVKLQSCATLFARVSPAGSAFHRILDRFFEGEPDGKTLALMEGGCPADSPAGGGSGPT